MSAPAVRPLPSAAPRPLLALVVAVPLAFAAIGCGHGPATDAGVGALTGAAVGAGVGGKKGAIVGGVVGAAAGVAIGQEQERRRAAESRYYDERAYDDRGYRDDAYYRRDRSYDGY